MSDERSRPGTVRRGGQAYQLEQRVRYDYSGPVTDLRQQLLLVPPRRHGGQRRHSWFIEVDGAEPGLVRSHTDTFDNHALHVFVPNVGSWLEFRVVTQLDVVPGAAVRVWPDRRYLAHTSLTAPGQALRSLVDTVGPGRDAAAVCAAVHAAMRYEVGVTDVATPAAVALAGGRGVCQDYAHVMLTVCRLLGLPARYVSGHLVGEGGSHAWVEVLRVDPHRPQSWLAEAWDPTHDRRATQGYVTVAVGRDYADAAPLSGTYDGMARGSLTGTKRLALI